MPLDDIVNVNIRRSTNFPSRPGFGTILLAAFHSATPNRIDFYGSITDVALDHAVTSAPYKMAQAAFSQSPRPARIAIGKRLLGTTMVVTLTPLLTTPGLTYAFSYVSPTGVQVDVARVNGGSETPTTIAAGLATQMASIAGAAAVAASGVLTITGAAPGGLFDLVGLPPLTQLKVKNTSADPGIATDLAAIAAVDSTSWYGLALDSNSKAEVLAAAAWVEATRKLFATQSSDSEIADNTVTTDVASSLKAAAYARTVIGFSQTRLLNFRAVGLMAKMFTTVPGSSTWEYQTISADTVDSIAFGLITNITAKNAWVYIVEANLNVSENVKMADGEFTDLVPGTDKLFADLQADTFGEIKAASDAGQKIPFTDIGVTQLVSVVARRLNRAVGEGFLANDPAPTASAPLVSTLTPAERSTRVAPPITLSAQLSGAIHKVSINVTLSA